MKKTILALMVMVVLSFSLATALTATRTISGSDITVTITPDVEMELTLQETLSGGATIVARSFPRDCGANGDSTTLTCDGGGIDVVTFTYSTEGSGTISGQVVGLNLEDFSSQTVDVTGDALVGAVEPVAPVEPAEPAADGDADVPPPPPPAPVDEPEPPVSRAPLTAADLADEADADGDGEVNSADTDDDGDDVDDNVDQCSNTFVGAERVADNGCLEGDLGAQPDGCVNNADVSAANFLNILLDDGFDGLSSLLWGMFDNWNAGEGTC